MVLRIMKRPFSISDAFFSFIRENINADPTKLLLKKHPELDFDLKLAVLQIECRKKIYKKLPDIFNLEHFLFPSSLSAEQCTCQAVAQFHSTLFKGMNSVLDLTSGVGIDDFYIAENVKELIAVEKNQDTASAHKYNMSVNNKNNVTTINDDCYNYIDTVINADLKFDAIYIDPARRDKLDKRVFGFESCEPNVLSMLDKISAVTECLYIKASPMIDITQAVKDIDNISDIWIIGVKNECKELLFKVNFSQKCNNKKIHTINFENDSCTQSLSFNWPVTEHHITYADSITDYIYEPNCCIMKAGAFNELQQEYRVLLKLGRNTHLFTCNEPIKDFPGRRFKVIEVIPFCNKNIKSIHAKYPKINVGVRNFKLEAQELKKRLKVNDGGNLFLFGVTLGDKEMIMVIAEKL